MARIVFSLVLGIALHCREALASCERVVSFAPSITEVFYSLGLGSRIVGVSRYDRYPAEVQSKPRIGGFLDTSFEVIAALRPTTVVYLKESSDAHAILEKLQVRELVVDHRTVDGILYSITEIGKLCGAHERARELREDLESQRDALRKETQGLEKIRTLISLGSEGGSGGIVSSYISGNDGFYSQLLEISGGVNVYQGQTASLPSVTFEGIYSLKPEVIIEVVAPEVGESAERRFDAWKQLKGIPAVHRNRVYIIMDDFAYIPGPRFMKLAQKFRDILHPKK